MYSAQFAQGHAVADRLGHVVDVGGCGVGDGTLHGEAADESWAVEDDDLEPVAVSGFAGGGFEEVAEDGFVGVEADAGVLQVDDDGVEVFEVFGLGALVGVLGAVEADDLEAGCGIDLLADVGRSLWRRRCRARGRRA